MNNYNNNISFYFITSKDRADIIVENVGNSVTLEKYDDEGYYRVIFNDATNSDMLALFHAGIRHGHNELVKALR